MSRRGRAPICSASAYLDEFYDEQADLYDEHDEYEDPEEEQEEYEDMKDEQEYHEEDEKAMIPISSVKITNIVKKAAPLPALAQVPAPPAAPSVTQSSQSPSSPSTSTSSDMDDLFHSFILIDDDTKQPHDDVISLADDESIVGDDHDIQQFLQHERDQEDEAFHGPRMLTLADFMFERPSAPKQRTHRSPTLTAQPQTRSPIASQPDIITPTTTITPTTSTTSTPSQINILTLAHDAGGSAVLIKEDNDSSGIASIHFQSSSSMDVWLLICFFLRPLDVCRLTSTCHAMISTLLSRSARYWKRLYQIRFGMDINAINMLPDKIQPSTGAHWLRQYALRVVYNRNRKYHQGFIPISLSTLPTAYPPTITQPCGTPPACILTSPNNTHMVTFHPNQTSSIHVYDLRPRPIPWSERPTRMSSIPLTNPMLRTLRQDNMNHTIDMSNHEDKYIHYPLIIHQLVHTFQAKYIAVQWDEDIIAVMSQNHIEIVGNIARPYPGSTLLATITTNTDDTQHEFVTMSWMILPVNGKDELTLVVCCSNGDVLIYYPNGTLIRTYPAERSSHASAKRLFHIYGQIVIRAIHTDIDIVKLKHDTNSAITPSFHNSASSPITSTHSCYHGVITCHMNGSIYIRMNDGKKNIIRHANDGVAEIVCINQELEILVIYKRGKQSTTLATPQNHQLLLYSFDTTFQSPFTTPSSTPTDRSPSTSSPIFHLFHTIILPSMLYPGIPHVTLTHDQIYIQMKPSNDYRIHAVKQSQTPSSHYQLISYLWSNLTTPFIVSEGVYTYHVTKYELIISESSGLILKSKLLDGIHHNPPFHTTLRVAKPGTQSHPSVGSPNYWFDPYIFRYHQRQDLIAANIKQQQTHEQAMEQARRFRLQQQQNEMIKERMKQKKIDQQQQQASIARKERQLAKERRGGRDRKNQFMG